MENESGDTKVNDDNKVKYELKLPILALVLDFSPFIAVFIAVTFYLPFLMFSIFAPVLGIIVGIISLCIGVKRIGKLGMILSIAAISLPIIFVLTVITIFATGAVAFSM